jgi:hypothetical protein
MVGTARWGRTHVPHNYSSIIALPKPRIAVKLHPPRAFNMPRLRCGVHLSGQAA